MAVGSPDSLKSEKIYADVLAEARNSCYKARDSFYACLEKESSKKPTELASVGLLYPSQCKKLREQYEKHCRVTWVKHFDRQYCAKRRLQRLLDSEEPRKGVYQYHLLDNQEMIVCLQRNKCSCSIGLTADTHQHLHDSLRVSSSD